MEHGTEYRTQRAGFRHFIDVARVLGVAVTRLATGGLSYEPIPYPMWQDDPLLSKLATRSAANKGDLATFENSLRMTREMVAGVRGALNEIGIVRSGDYDPVARIKMLQGQLDALIDTSVKLSRDIVKRESVWEEQQWMQDYLQP